VSVCACVLAKNIEKCFKQGRYGVYRRLGQRKTISIGCFCTWYKSRLFFTPLFQLLPIIGFMVPPLLKSHVVLARDLVENRHGIHTDTIAVYEINHLAQQALGICPPDTTNFVLLFTCSFSALFLSLPRAAHILRGTGKTVNLVVAKQAAVYYGLTHLIHQPSPRYSRKHNPHR